MAPLQEQFLKAGLVNKGKAKQVHQEKAKQKKDERRAGTQERRRGAPGGPRDPTQERRAGPRAQRHSDAAATQKAIMAQIAQMVQQNRQSKGKGDVAYNFTHDNKIKRCTSPKVREHLIAGHLVIVCLGEATELLPKVIADKIAERDPSLVVQIKKASTEVEAIDPHAAFQVPDDPDVVSAAGPAPGLMPVKAGRPIPDYSRQVLTADPEPPDEKPHACSPSPP